MKLFDITKMDLKEAYKWQKTIDELVETSPCKKKLYFYHKHQKELRQFIADEEARKSKMSINGH